ncbi:MAG: DUF1684 domain-containing protein [Crocinitomicaceae bacterium]|nr:DUF1684 domain-containing protein [Crocinitomicaceae bacterium]MBK8927062.1 DUF1684 domain-containing protein [Crocinitomicaceae bacterium]
MRFYLLIILIPLTEAAFSQKDSSFYRDEFFHFWQEQDAHFKSKELSPLPKKMRKKFPGHQHFNFSINYVVTAHFERIESTDTIIMKTSADTEKKYVHYALVRFSLHDAPCSLYVYQSLSLREIEEYKNHLFIPFRDATNGNETYGAGRYIDLLIPNSDSIVINFNHAYNPYCAYTDGYFCPIPPKENTLKIEIKAGAKIPLETANH